MLAPSLHKPSKIEQIFGSCRKKAQLMNLLHIFKKFTLIDVWLDGDLP